MNAVVLLSGGIDSAVALAGLRSDPQVEGIIAASVECQVGAIFSRAANSFTPLGVAANLVLISEDENVAAASGSVQ